MRDDFNITPQQHQKPRYTPEEQKIIAQQAALQSDARDFPTSPAEATATILNFPYPSKVA